MQTLLAYLDAGSGSMIIQIIVGGFAAAAVSLKLFWTRVLTFLHIKKKDETATDTPAATTGEGHEPEHAVAETR
jgi:hypothetical protein